jgi:putative sterol carrier protein
MKRHDSLRPTAAPKGAVVAFEITDSDECFHVAAREGVATVLAGRPDGADATVRLPHRVWMALLLGLTSPCEALLAEGVEAEGNLAEFVRFHRRFTTAAAGPSGTWRPGDGDPKP